MRFFSINVNKYHYGRHVPASFTRADMVHAANLKERERESEQRVLYNDTTSTRVKTRVNHLAI